VSTRLSGVTSSEWRQVLTQEAKQARPILLKLLNGRVTVTPARSWPLGNARPEYADRTFRRICTKSDGVPNGNRPYLESRLPLGGSGRMTAVSGAGLEGGLRV
jgi:hypothetical protein